MKFYVLRYIAFMGAWILSALVALASGQDLVPHQPEEQDTYSISLVKTAEVDSEVYQVENKKVLAETVTVVKGDHLWQIFRERGLLGKRELPLLIDALKSLNKSLTNLDLIYPGDKIIIPLSLIPVTAKTRSSKAPPPETVGPEELEKIKFEYYTVKPGDSLVKVVKGHYDIPADILRRDYLDLVRRLNPTIQDLNLIHPGQVIKLPIYSPQIVRMPIAKPTSAPSSEATPPRQQLITLTHELGDIFNQIGEEWVQTGQHFIPLKSGGQINLKADSYPILNLANGNRIIIDAFHLLPEKMVELITSNWHNYRIVHLEEGDDLGKALEKIFPLCGYPKIYPPDQRLRLEGDIKVEIGGDWIIETTDSRDGETGRVAVISIVGNQKAATPFEIKDFLKGLGVNVIDFPRADGGEVESRVMNESWQPVFNKSDLIERILRLSGQGFSKDVEIPVYRSQNTDFNLIINADFLFQKDGVDCLIDLTGLEPSVLELLKEHQFKVLSLSEADAPMLVASRTLEFIGVKARSGMHSFLAAERDAEKNIKLSIPGIVFRDSRGQSVFATQVILPNELATFLMRRGYSILGLSLS